MKKYIFTLFLIAAATGISVQAHGQAPDYLGLPGDNLNLFAVMKLFQESPTLEAFERDLNNEDMRINNLDLDMDGRIDYIQVVDNVDGSYHTIVLQDALSPRDIQDVAVFTVQRDRRGRVSIQLTGDEALYGRDYIVEPNYADLDYDETPNPGYAYNNGETVVVRTTTYEVAAWPVIRFIYMPNYVVWHSPWYYNYYPSYWHPWRPYYWHYYYGYHYNWDHYYYGHYRVYDHHRHQHWHDTYYSHRNYTPVVAHRIESGSYRKTYSRPEARRAGYDMYYKKHPEESARRSYRTLADPVARTKSQSVNDSRQRSAGGTGSGRRSLGESRGTDRGSGNVQTNTRTTQSTQTTRTTRTQAQNQTQTKTRTLSQPQPGKTERSAGTRSGGSEQKQRATRSQTERRSSDANTSGTSKKPAEKKESDASKTRETRGGRRAAI